MPACSPKEMSGPRAAHTGAPSAKTRPPTTTDPKSPYKFKDRDPLVTIARNLNRVADVRERSGPFDFMIVIK